MQRIGDKRARHPGDVPDAELAVGVGAERAARGDPGPLASGQVMQEARARPAADTRRIRAGARWCRAGPACRIARHCSAGHPRHVSSRCRRRVDGARRVGVVRRHRLHPRAAGWAAAVGVLPARRRAPRVASLAGAGRRSRSACAAVNARGAGSRRSRRSSSSSPRGCRSACPAVFLIWTGATRVAGLDRGRDRARRSWPHDAWSSTAPSRPRDRLVVAPASSSRVIFSLAAWFASPSMPGRGRAALPRHHAEPAPGRRSADREQPSARRLPRLLRRRSAAALGRRGRNGEIYSIHAPGLPALVLPAFAIAVITASWSSSSCWQSAACALAWWLAWRVTGSRPRRGSAGRGRAVGAVPARELHGVSRWSRRVSC